MSVAVKCGALASLLPPLLPLDASSPSPPPPAIPPIPAIAIPSELRKSCVQKSVDWLQQWLLLDKDEQTDRYLWFIFHASITWATQGQAFAWINHWQENTEMQQTTNTQQLRSQFCTFLDKMRQKSLVWLKPSGRRSRTAVQKQTVVSRPRQSPLEGFSKIRLFWPPHTKLKFHFKEKKHKHGQLICVFPLQKRPVNTSQSPWETSFIYQRARCRPGCCCHWI